MGLRGILRGVDPRKWLGGGDSVTVTYEQPSFLVGDHVYESLEDALVVRSLAQEFDLPTPSPPRTPITLQPMSTGRRVIWYLGLRLRIVDQGHFRSFPGGRDTEHRLEWRLGLVNTKQHLFGG